jgi:2-oxoglutarate ferredoxin oxidoreductase subunit alpha
VLTATSGPGLSLYSETIGLAIMGEVPLVIVDAQRMGPATGGATTPAQADIQFVRWGNSGGYPIIALCPSSVAECYGMTRRAFDLAERFRVPVFLMTDKEMFLSMSTVEVDTYAHPPVRARLGAAPLPPGTAGLRREETFLPWRFEPLDQPPEYSPYGAEHIVRFTGSSHDEHGMLTKDPAKVGRLNEHLWRKIEDHCNEIELVSADLQPGARTLLVAYGITARAMTEAANAYRAAPVGEHAVSALTIQSLWPVPERAILAALQGADGRCAVERVVVAEMNHGQYRREIERVIYASAASGSPAARSRQSPPEIIGVTRVDGELITPAQIAAGILA